MNFATIITNPNKRMNLNRINHFLFQTKLLLGKGRKRMLEAYRHRVDVRHQPVFPTYFPNETNTKRRKKRDFLTAHDVYPLSFRTFSMGVAPPSRRNRMRKMRSPLKYEKKPSFANYREEIAWINRDQLASPLMAQQNIRNKQSHTKQHHVTSPIVAQQSPNWTFSVGVAPPSRRNRMRKIRSPLKYEKKPSFTNYREEIAWIERDQLTSPLMAQQNTRKHQSHTKQRHVTSPIVAQQSLDWMEVDYTYTSAPVSSRWNQRPAANGVPRRATAGSQGALRPSSKHSQSFAKHYGRQYYDRQMQGKSPSR